LASERCTIFGDVTFADFTPIGESKRLMNHEEFIGDFFHAVIASVRLVDASHYPPRPPAPLRPAPFATLPIYCVNFSKDELTADLKLARRTAVAYSEARGGYLAERGRLNVAGGLTKIGVVE
jgi:hypothetical protein